MSYDPGKFVHTNESPVTNPPSRRAIGTLDEWEANAAPVRLDKKIALISTSEVEERINYRNAIIRSLIDLVRKKDGAILNALTKGDREMPISKFPQITYDSLVGLQNALALTEELK